MNFKTSPLTEELLTRLKEKGYRYVRVTPLGGDGRVDYIQPMAIILDPVLCVHKGEPQHMEVYESIESSLLRDWAKASIGVQVVVNLNI